MRASVGLISSAAQSCGRYGGTRGPWSEGRRGVASNSGTRASRRPSAAKVAGAFQQAGDRRRHIDPDCIVGLGRRYLDHALRRFHVAPANASDLAGAAASEYANPLYRWETRNEIAHAKHAGMM
jgi:hypothetical protein